MNIKLYFFELELCGAFSHHSPECERLKVSADDGLERFFWLCNTAIIMIWLIIRQFSTAGRSCCCCCCYQRKKCLKVELPLKERVFVFFLTQMNPCAGHLHQRHIDTLWNWLMTHSDAGPFHIPPIILPLSLSLSHPCWMLAPLLLLQRKSLMMMCCCGNGAGGGRLHGRWAEASR